MLKCEKCGTEYQSEVHFRQRGEGDPLICIQCDQVTSPSQGRVNKIGLAVAALFIFFGVLAARDPDMGGLPGIMFFAAALALGIRSFLPGMTWGRGTLTAFGGLFAGEVPIFLIISGGKNVFALVVPAIIAFAFLKYGFKSGPIQWRKKKAKEPEDGRSPD